MLPLWQIRASSTDPDTVGKTIALQKVLTELGLAPDDVSKFMRLQKSMYDNGASPQDIAMVMQSLMEGGADIAGMARTHGQTDEKKGGAVS